MTQVFLASRNRKKIEEMERILREHLPGIEVLGIDDVEGYEEPVEDQPTCSPAVRPMWAIMRAVVVFPLVPVTAMTGTFGLIVVGWSPRSAVRTTAAASLTRWSTSSLGSASSTAATASPKARARARFRHG